MSAALGAALKSRPPRLAYNPAAAAAPPSAKQTRAPEMHPWTAAQPSQEWLAVVREAAYEAAAGRMTALGDAMFGELGQVVESIIDAVAEAAMEGAVDAAGRRREESRPRP